MKLFFSSWIIKLLLLFCKRNFAYKIFQVRLFRFSIVVKGKVPISPQTSVCLCTFSYIDNYKNWKVTTHKTNKQTKKQISIINVRSEHTCELLPTFGNIIRRMPDPASPHILQLYKIWTWQARCEFTQKYDFRFQTVRVLWSSDEVEVHRALSVLRMSKAKLSTTQDYNQRLTTDMILILIISRI